MSENRLHPDFPPTEEVAEGSWHFWPDPLDDIATALATSSADLGLSDIERVTDYYVSSEAGVWKPGGTVATELALYLVGKTRDGRWFGLDAGNDYTGWGCQDYSDIYIGTSREDVIANGLTNDARSALGMELA